MEAKTVIIGTLGVGDPHFIGSYFLGRVLSDAGFKVVDLGCNCTLQEFVEAAIEAKASAILISSLLGYAETEVSEYQDILREAGLQHVVSYIGGNLVIGYRTPDEIKQRFKESGFTRVYPGTTDFEQVVEDLKTDLRSK